MSPAEKHPKNKNLLNNNPDFKTLEESEKYYRTIVENMVDALFIHDFSGNIIDVNKNSEKKLGYSREELLKANVMNISADIEKLSKEMEKIINNGWSVFDSKNVKKNGEIYPVSVSAKLISKENGGSIQCICRDISERIIMENKLKNSEDKFYKAFMLSPDIVLINRLSDGKIVDVNKTFEVESGYSAAEAVGKNTDELKLYSNPEERAEIYKSLKEKGEVLGREVKMQNKKGEPIVVLLSTRVVEIANEKCTITIARNITEKIKIEQALKDSKEMFLSAFKNSPDSISIVRCDSGKIIDINNGFTEFTGYSEKEAIGKTFKDIGLVLDSSFPVENILNTETAGIEFAWRNKNGKNKIGLISSRTMFENKIKCLLFTVRDITIHKRMENELIQSEEKYSKVFMSSPIPIVITNINDGVIISANLSFKKTFGYTIWEMIDHSVLPHDLGIIVDKKEREGYIKILKKSGYVDDYEVKFKNKKGVIIAGVLSARIIDLQGKKYMLSMIRDVSENKRAEEALATERERLAVTLRSIGEGVITTDLEGNIININNKAEALTGWRFDEVYGKPLNKILKIKSDNSGKTNADLIDKVLKTGAVIEVTNQIKLISKNDKEITITVILTPIINSENKIIGAVLVFRDETEKQKMTESLQKIDKLNSLGVFAGGLAHDFNNLLTGIFGYIELEKLEMEGRKERSDNIDRSLEVLNRARDLIKQLLTFSKGGSPSRKITIMAPLLKKSVQFALSGSKIKVKYKIPANLWNAEIDSHQIEQVIDNIVLNARDAMPSGGVVTVIAENINLQAGKIPSLKEGAYIKLTFKDTGTGIQEEHLSRIFDPFFTTKKKGHGLGLATAFSIISKHNGYIDAESVLHKGTSFYVILPAVKKAKAAKIPKKEQNVKVTGRVLLMDDEKYIRDFTIKLLRFKGFDAVSSKDAEDALVKYRKALKVKKPFDVVILDLTVPGGKGGKEAIIEIRKIDKNIPVIASSGYSEDPVIANPRDFGFTDSLRKPYVLSDLMKLLKKYLDGKQ